MSTGLVSQHQLASYSNPQAGQAGTASVVLGNDNTTVTGYNTHDSDATIHLQNSTLVGRPAASAQSGAPWMTVDTAVVRLFYSNGASWVELNNVGVPFTVTSTSTSQVTIAYDATTSMTVSISSAGVATLNASGPSPSFVFSDSTTFTAAVVITTGGFTVASGTSALQAITGTTLVLSGSLTGVTSITMNGAFTGATTVFLSGILTSTVTAGTIYNAASATTAAVNTNISNTGGDIVTGVAGGASTSVFTGTTTYAAIVGCVNNRPLMFAVNGGVVSIISAVGLMRWTAYGAGSLTTDGSGNITAVSDERLKDRIQPFTRGREALRGIVPILHGYTKKSGLDTKDLYVGFGAKNVKAHIPETVGMMADGTLTLSDRGLLAAAINTINDLVEEVATLRASRA